MTREVMQQAFDLIERLNKHGWILADFETEVYATLNSLKAALEQPPLPVQPVQEPMVWDKPSASFNQWWNGDYDGSANPYDPDSKAHWAWAGWKAAQTVQEPVAWMYTSHWKGDERFITRYQSELTTYKADKVWPLYTTPPEQRKPLTDEEILDATCHLGGWNIDVARCVINHARAIETAHGIKGDA